jgi:hypothetical protein
MTFKMKGYSYPGKGPLKQKNPQKITDPRSNWDDVDQGDYKVANKKIVLATDVETKGGKTIPTESINLSKRYPQGVNVYKKTLPTGNVKRYVSADGGTDSTTGMLEIKNLGELRKEGSLITKRQQRETKGLYGRDLQEALGIVKPSALKQTKKEQKKINKINLQKMYDEDLKTAIDDKNIAHQNIQDHNKAMASFNIHFNRIPLEERTPDDFAMRDSMVKQTSNLETIYKDANKHMKKMDKKSKKYKATKVKKNNTNK